MFVFKGMKYKTKEQIKLIFKILLFLFFFIMAFDKSIFREVGYILDSLNIKDGSKIINDLMPLKILLDARNLSYFVTSAMFIINLINAFAIISHMHYLFFTSRKINTIETKSSSGQSFAAHTINKNPAYIIQSSLLC